ncbi:MAG: PQQ-dependent sugar dehydrogenase [Vulcanimicrobiaceae bacterium]
MIQRGPLLTLLLTFALVTDAFAAAAAAGGAPRVPAGFSIQKIATVESARELAFAPNGDLIVGTYGDDVYVVPNADGSGSAGVPKVFAHFDNQPAAGVFLDGDVLYVGTQFGVYRIPFRAGDRSPRGAPQKIAAVRTSGVSRDHATTSVAVSHSALYASIGSSCNACQPELDDTRATIQRVGTDGKLEPKAVHIRNAIALTTNQNTGMLWAGVAGEDDLPVGHPYEIFDAAGAHDGVADYGWPYCYENRKQNPVPRWAGHDCTKTAVPLVVFPAYQTPIGAAFYPARGPGKYAFPAKYRGGAFVALHGSWHGPGQGLSAYMPPRVVFVAMHGDEPATAVNWANPNAQWTEFVSGYQDGGSHDRIGRPTGIAVGPQGDLFVADDQTGAIYRIRPKTP